MTRADWGAGCGFGFEFGFWVFLYFSPFLNPIQTQPKLVEFKFEFEFNANTQTIKTMHQHECNNKIKPKKKNLITCERKLI